MTKNKNNDEIYSKINTNLIYGQNFSNPNKQIVENIRLVYDVLSRKVINCKDAIELIHDIIGHYTNDAPLMSYSNSNKTVTRKKK